MVALVLRALDICVLSANFVINLTHPLLKVLKFEYLKQYKFQHHSMQNLTSDCTEKLINPIFSFDYCMQFYFLNMLIFFLFDKNLLETSWKSSCIK